MRERPTAAIILGMSKIVVGVDGSAEAMEALRWALGEAQLRGAALQVVHAWQFPPPGIGPFAGPYDGELIQALRHDAEHLVERALREAEVPDGIHVEKTVVEGAAAPTLVEVAADADLLVVGSRGHGGFTGLLLGSVSQQCAQHARCPVVIVRTHGDGRR
jgi:nucleotide-binding universal stress UspA family protein